MFVYMTAIDCLIKRVNNWSISNGVARRLVCRVVRTTLHESMKLISSHLNVACNVAQQLCFAAIY